MANALTKDKVIIEVVGYEQIPAKPYRPAQPPRTVFETRRVCMFRYSGPGKYFYSYDPSTGQVTGTFIPDNVVGGNAGGEVGVWACTNELVGITYPAVPAQPYVPGFSYVSGSTFETGYNLGWNAGGRSIAEFKGDGYVDFKVRSNVVGVICGINFYDGVASNYNGNTIDFAFYCARGLVWTMRNGAIVAAVGTYDDSTLFSIERSGSEGSPTISYLVNGEVVYSVEADVPTAAGWLEAALYSGDDQVFDPYLEQISPPDLSPETGELNASLEAMSFFGAQGSYAALSAELEPVRFAGTAGLVAPSYAVGNFQLPPLSATVNALVGEIGSLEASLEPLVMLAADHPYGEIRAELEPLTAALNSYEGNLSASMSSIGAVASALVSSTLLVVTFNSAGQVASTMTIDALVDAAMFSSGQAVTEWDLNGLFDVSMNSLGLSGSVLGVPAEEADTWVVNLANNGSTNYTNYAFNSFASIGGRSFGASSDGIFELDGDTDDGEPIRAVISLGKLDFGTAEKKTVSECYLGMSGQGNLFVKVIAEGEAYIYKTRDFSPELQQQRVKFGKGLRTNYVELEIYNEEGAEFELDTVRFEVADLSRRI